MVDDVTGWKNSGEHIAEFIHEAMTLAKGIVTTGSSRRASPMPELTPQHEARNIAALAAWCMFEAEIHETLTAAG